MSTDENEGTVNGVAPVCGKDAKRGARKAKRGQKEKWVFFACAILSIIAVAAIVLFILINSVPAFAEIGFFNFLFGTKWFPDGYRDDPSNAGAYFGILPMIVNSLCVTLFALLLGGILGIFSALFLVYWCPEKMKKTVEQLINVFAGIPSVMYGFFGLTFIVPLLARITGTTGLGIMACTLVLMLMILPTIASMSKNALRSVPESYYEGAIALGATKEQAIFTVMLPAAKSGVVSGLIMGMGRAVGEAMAVKLVAGGVASFPEGLFSPIRTMTSSIAMEMGYASGLQREALIATGLILLVFVLLLNFAIARVNRTKSSADGGKGADGKKIPKGGANASVAAEAVYVGRRKFGAKTPSQEFVYKKKGVVCRLLKYFSFAVSVFVGASLVLLVGYILVNGLPSMPDLFAPDIAGELGNAVFGTLMLILLSLVIAVPLGICAAIYLHEYARPGSVVVKAIRLFNDTLGGVPSIVFGLFGNIVFVNWMGMSQCLLAGALTMALIILPTIIRSVEESLIAVPDSLREASLSLGASKLQTIFKVVLPQALPGIFTAIVLSIGRIVGESAALIFTMGSSLAFLPQNIVGRGNASCSLTVFMYVLANEGAEMNIAYGLAVILLIIVAFVYVGLGLLEHFGKNKGEKKCKEKVKPSAA